MDLDENNEIPESNSIQPHESERQEVQPQKPKYRGVSYDKRNQRYRAQIDKESIGSFEQEIHAAWRFNECILERFENDERWMVKLNNISKPDNYKTPKKRQRKDENLPKGVCTDSKSKAYIVSFMFKKAKICIPT